MRHIFKSRRARVRALMADFEENQKAEEEENEKASESMEESLFKTNEPVPEQEWHRYQFNRDKANRKSNKYRQQENKITRELLIDHIIACDWKNLVVVAGILVLMFFAVSYMGPQALDNFSAWVASWF